MTWGFSAQRRADEFDAQVEGRSISGPAGIIRDAELLELVGAMRSLPPVQARPEFVADLRAQLMAEAQTVLVPDDVSRLQLPQRHTRRERRLAALVAGVAIVGASTSVAVAAQSALPGESLYPIKRVIESAHTGVSLADGAKGSVLLGNASNRLAEVRALSSKPDEDDQIAQALSAFTDQATSAADLLLADYDQHGDASSVQSLRAFVASSLTELQALEPMVPYDARDELLGAAAALARIDADAVKSCSSCDPGPLADLPAALAGERITLPTMPAAPVTDHRKADGKHKGTSKNHQPSLPAVDSNDLGPANVNAPGSTSGPKTSSITDSLTGLTEQLTGGDKTAKSPRVPVVSDVIDGVGDLLHGVIDPVTDGLTGKN